MFVNSIRFSLFSKLFFFAFIEILVFAILCFSIFCIFQHSSTNEINSVFKSDLAGEDFINQIFNISAEEFSKDSETSKSYIKWVDFKGTSSLLKKLSDLDINSHIKNEPIKLNWIELMAYLGCKYGGNLSLFKQADLDALILKLQEGKTMQELTANMKLYNYFYQSYDAIFHEYIGEYEIETADTLGNKSYTKKYGLKAFLPIAKNYSFSHYKDFRNC